MLKGSIKHRTRELVAVYVEPRRTEVLRAHRQWRSWVIDSAETFAVPPGEGVYDSLQRLNLRPKGRTGTSLVLFLPHIFYNFHREHYPSTLEDQLDEALEYDWQENIFYEQGRTVHFSAQPVRLDHQLSVPIFSFQRDLYEKFQQALNGESFQTFTVMPSALLYEAFLPPAMVDEETTPIQIMGRILDPEYMEIHRFYKNLFLDSMIVGKQLYSLTLFQENLQCVQEGREEGPLPIQVIGVDEDENEDVRENWKSENLNLQELPVQGPLVLPWVKQLLTRDEVKTFDTQLLLKPWEVPKVIYPVLALVGIFAIYTYFQVHASNRLQEESRMLKRQTLQLETQWKPIEELQTRISKFEQDQKTLSEFNAQGYPLLELLTLLSQVTTDETWLNYFSLKKGQMMLRGESKSAIKYLSELTKVEGFQDVKFASPVTRNPTSDQERFNLQLEINLEKLKKTITDLQIDKAVEEIPQDAAISVPVETGERPGAEAHPVAGNHRSFGNSERQLTSWHTVYHPGRSLKNNVSSCSSPLPPCFFFW